MSARRWMIGGGIVVVAAVVALAVVLWPRGTTEVDQQQALESFRRQEASGTTAVAPGARVTPKPGVYTYAAEGHEEIKIGPLPTETRTLPATITAVSVDDPADPGCFDWTINRFAEHTEDTRWCTTPALRLASHVKHHRVGALAPTFTMTCDPGQLPIAGGDPTTKVDCSLAVAGGPISVNTAIAGTATRSAEPATVDVGGTTVPVTRIAIHFPVTGSVSGVWDETTYWTADHLPVRIERELDLSGPATMKETSTLRLTALEPTS